MFKKIISILAALAIFAGAAQAQGVFVEAGLGSNYLVKNGFGGYGLSAKGAVGYMFNPMLGARLDLQLGIGRATPEAAAWFEQGRYIKAAVAADLLWDVLPTFTEKHYLYHVQPYVRIQETLGVKRAKAACFGAGGGIRQLLGFKAEDHLFLVLDVSAVAAGAKCWTGEDGAMILGQATFGFAWQF